MENGWIKLHRKLLDNPISHKPLWGWLWVVLLLKANHEDKEIIWNGKSRVMESGTFITGRKVLSVESGLSETTIERVLDYLTESGQIGQQKTNKFRLITITKWKEYQIVGQQKDNKKTTDGQQKDTDKNTKNVKNDKNNTKSIAQSSFGNQDINVLSEYLQTHIGGSLDGSVKENRQYANLLINRFKKDYPTRDSVELIKIVIDRGVADRFHAKNLTNFKYLYYNAQKIIMSAKSDLNKNHITKIS